MVKSKLVFQKTKLPRKLFWKNKRIFLTGHTGFKGSWLIIWLESLGSKVKGYSNSYITKPHSLYRLLKKKNFKKDINNFNILKKNIFNFKPDIVIHCAAQSSVSQAFVDPVTTYNTNIIGTVNILEICKKIKKIKIVAIITTDKCYEENDYVSSYKENSTLGGSEPYSASKACSEIISKSYLNQYKLLGKKIITLRSGNVIGGGDWKRNRIIPDFIDAKYNNLNLIIRNKEFIRPWQYILDCLNGYLLAIEYTYKKKIFFNTWNFSPQLKYQKSVNWLVIQLSKKFNFNLKKIKFLKIKKYYKSPRLNLNSSKANLELGWYPMINGRLLVNWIHDWYKSFYLKNDVYQICYSQIKKFYKINNK